MQLAGCFNAINTSYMPNISPLTHVIGRRFGQVSDDWNDVISEDKKAAHRRRSHIRELKITLEVTRLTLITVQCMSVASSPHLGSTYGDLAC